MSGDYKKALIHYNVYLEQKNTLQKNRISIEKYKKLSVRHWSDENPVPIQSEVSARDKYADNEYWPSYYSWRADAYVYTPGKSRW